MKDKRPEWHPGRMASSDRTKESHAKDLFEALLYIGDQIKDLNETMSNIRREGLLIEKKEY